MYVNDKCDDYDFGIVNFPFLDGDVPRSTSYGIYLSQFIRFARAFSHMADFYARSKVLIAKAIGIINFELFFFLNFIADTIDWFLSLRSDSNLFCNRVCRNNILW